MKTFQLNPERGEFDQIPSSSSVAEQSRSETSICYNFLTGIWLVLLTSCMIFFPLVDAMGGKEKENHDSSGRRSKGGETAMRVFSWLTSSISTTTTMILLLLPAENSHILLAHKTPFFFFSRQAVRECQNTAPGSKLLLASLQKIAKVQNPEKIIH